MDHAGGAAAPGRRRAIRAGVTLARRYSKKDSSMRFMMLVKASKASEAGAMPDDSLIAAMTK